MSPNALELPAEVIDLLGGADAKPVVVAVSGGSDSVALVRVMDDARRAGRLPPVHLAHLNHKIRREEAASDAAFVRRLAERLALPMTYGEIDVPEVARTRRISLEYAARECRYEFLESAARSIGAKWIALGHTADDQLETVLHHLLRGAGIHGLAGMPMCRGLTPGSDIRIVRPLIGFTRRQLIDELTARGETYCTDHTNLDVTYTRNRIRHRLVPVLEKTWPDIRSDVSEFARVLGDLDAALEEAAQSWIASHAREQGRALTAELGALGALEEPVASYVVRGMIAHTLGDLRRIDEVHVRMVLELVSSGSSGASLDLPRGLVVRRGYDCLEFEQGGAGVTQAPEPGVLKGREKGTRNLLPVGPEGASHKRFLVPFSRADVELVAPGEACWGPWDFTATVLDGHKVWQELIELSGCVWEPELEHPPEDPRERMRRFIEVLRRADPAGVEYLDLDRVGTERLTIRSRRPGDRFSPLGAPGSRKLKDFLITRKVPRTERDFVPLVVAGDRILVVVGLSVSDKVALSEETRRVLKITAVCEDR